MPDDPKTAGDGPEMTRLLARLFPDDPTKPRCKHFNAWWGPDAASMTKEQRAAAINRVLDMDERGELQRITAAEIDGDTPQVDVRDWLKERGL